MVKVKCEDCTIEFESSVIGGAPQPKCPSCLSLHEESLIDDSEYTEPE